MSTVLQEFAEEFGRCWICGSRGDWRPLQIHHICRGPNREKTLNERCTLIRCCANCHEDKLDSMSVVRQVAIKMLFDPEWYNRVAVNRFRGRADDAISEQDIAVEISFLIAQPVDLII